MRGLLFDTLTKKMTYSSSVNKVKIRSFDWSKSFLNKSIRSFYCLKVLTWPLSLCSALPCDLAKIIPAQNYSTIVKTLQEWTRYPIRVILSGVFPSYSGVDQFRLEHKQDSLSDSSGPHFSRTSSSHSMFNLTWVKNTHQSQDHFVIDVVRAGLMSRSTWKSWNHPRQKILVHGSDHDIKCLPHDTFV